MTTSLLIWFLNGINLYLQTTVSVTEGDKIGAGLPQSAACICGRGQGKALMKSPPPFCCSPAAHHNTSWRWKCEDKKQKPPNFCRTVLSKHIEICLLASAQSGVPSLSTCCLTHEECTAHSPYSVYLSLPPPYIRLHKYFKSIELYNPIPPKNNPEGGQENLVWI